MDAALEWLKANDPEYGKPRVYAYKGEDGEPIGFNPVRTFCDGSYEELEEGCYRRLPANIGSEDY